MLFDFKDFQPWDPELYITGALGFVRLSHTPLLVLRVHHSFSQITHQRVTSDDCGFFSACPSCFSRTRELSHRLLVVAAPLTGAALAWPVAASAPSRHASV